METTLNHSNNINYTISIPPEVYEDIKREAELQDRSVGWLFKKAWAIARERITRWRPNFSTK